MDDATPKKPPFSIADAQRDRRHRELIDKLHAEFGLRFVPDPDMASGHALALKKDAESDWRIDGFLQLLSERMQPAIAEYIEQHDKREAAKNASRLVGGPFDGEQIEVHKRGGTEARKVRERWWAVYKRKPGEYAARFVGFATSKANALTYTLAHATPASEFKPQPEAE